MTDRDFLKNDIETMKKSIEFHETRIKNFGKLHPKGHVYPFSDVDPKHILPYLKKMLKQMKTKLRTSKSVIK
jgi:hypothetical protein